MHLSLSLSLSLVIYVNQVLLMVDLKMQSLVDAVNKLLLENRRDIKLVERCCKSMETFHLRVFLSNFNDCEMKIPSAIQLLKELINDTVFTCRKIICRVSVKSIIYYIILLLFLYSSRHSLF